MKGVVAISKPPIIADVQIKPDVPLPDILSANDRLVLSNPVPTPPPDIVETLCIKAVREVEGLRTVNDAQVKYIASLEEKDKLTVDFIKSQKGLIDTQTSALKDATDIIANDKKEIANREEKITNLNKEIEILKKNKCGLICKIGLILTGFAVKSIIK